MKRGTAFLAVAAALLAAIVVGCGETSEQDVADLLIEQTPVEHASCIKSDRERDYVCNVDRGGGGIKVGVKVSESGDRIFITHCEARNTANQEKDEWLTGESEDRCDGIE